MLEFLSIRDLRYISKIIIDTKIRSYIHLNLSCQWDKNSLMYLRMITIFYLLPVFILSWCIHKSSKRDAQFHIKYDRFNVSAPIEFLNGNWNTNDQRKIQKAWLGIVLIENMSVRSVSEWQLKAEHHSVFDIEVEKNNPVNPIIAMFISIRHFLRWEFPRSECFSRIPRV